jgi:meso-butanediol dehydrogenase/(S,S)-butanediol dehydrogenase/diacetyl reductase
MKLQGKVAIVTGAGRGIGRGIAQCLADEGANLAICSRTLNELESLAEELRALGGKVLPLSVDLVDASQISGLVQCTMKNFGRIDVLVNNAGAASREGVGIISLEDKDWDDAYELNLKSVARMCKAVVPHMIAQKMGKIINISSVAAKMGDGHQMPYASMKGAIVSLTRALARELATHNINVNCICPGLIYTPLWEKRVEALCRTVPIYQEMNDPKDIFVRYVKRLVPLRREQTAEDIGRAVAFLASEEAKNITGQSLNVDGGMVMD